MPELKFNLDATVDFLVGLLNTPSPTGYYVEGIEYVRQAFSAIPDLELSTTGKGALLATWRGISSDAPRALTAHVDTLGALVKEIKPSGRLKLTQLGNYMWNAIEFEGVTIRTATTGAIAAPSCRPIPAPTSTPICAPLNAPAT